MTQLAAGQKISISEINQMSDAGFCSYLSGLFEKTTWIVASAAPLRPFASKGALFAAMVDSLMRAEPARKLALLQAHPVLGGQAARRGEMTAESRSEQAGLGFQSITGDEERVFADLNQAYLDRFGFPFIIAVRGQRDRQAIAAALRQRFESSPEAERETALAEVIKIARFRFDGLVAEDKTQDMMSPLTLSIHVLDTAGGSPGAGLAFSLSRIEEGDIRAVIATGVTDAAGRWAMDHAAPLQPGVYEIVFDAADYQEAQGRDSFYDRIAVRFRMKPAAGHHHIPLILSPFGYSTYRGG
jgi:2-oxo-4-hydroxy-4-carboxy-5-ureidoimidazoline decarboxylase